MRRNRFQATGVNHASTHTLRKGGTTKFYNDHGSVALVQQQHGVTNLKTAQVYTKPLQSDVDKYIASLYEKKKSL